MSLLMHIGILNTLPIQYDMYYTKNLNVLFNMQSEI
jgi:hypothetical protein